MNKNNSTEKQLTEEEAQQLATLLPKLHSEMNDRLLSGDYDGSLYTTIIRNKDLRYLTEVYGVETPD